MPTPNPSPDHQRKVRVVIECSKEDRARIKTLAASKHMTISEYLLKAAGLIKAPSQTPNLDTISAMSELESGGGHSFDSLADFWKGLGIDPNA